MITHATLALLGYLAASAYVLVPALLLLLCAALAHVPVRVDLPEPEQRLARQRDVYAACALDALHAFYAWRGVDDRRAASAQALAWWYTRRAWMLDELLASLV